MALFMVEVPHPEGEIPCAHAVKNFLDSGSHILEHADWGCKDGVHKAWFQVDVNTKDEARYIVPPAFRTQTVVTRLNKFTADEIESILVR